MKNVRCNLCGSDSAHLLFKGTDRLHHTDNATFPYVRCEKCGLVYMNPQLEPAELPKYYPDEYGPYNESAGTFKYGPISNLFRTKQKEEKRVAAEAHDVPKRYLDFGCGSGEHLSKIQKLHPHWELSGLDNSPTACARTKERGFTVYCGELSEVTLPAGHFDIIYMSHVIEHLNDPADVIERLYEALAPGGELVIQTPNVRSLAASIFRSYWYASDAPRHLYLFSPETLSALLTKKGLEVAEIEFDAGPKTGIRSVYLLFGKKDLRIDPFTWRVGVPFSRFLARMGRTSIMTVRARRP